MQHCDLFGIFEAVDGAPGEPHDRIAGVQSGALRRAAGNDKTDDGRRVALAGGHEQQCQNEDREKIVDSRAGEHDGGALRHVLVVETDLALLGGQPIHSLAGTARRVSVAEHLDVAAERDGAEPPPGSPPVVPAEQFGAEADGKDLDPHAVAPGDGVVPHFVDEDEQREQDQKWQDVVPED